jgi:ParB family chromosome partitioning protein
VQDEPGAHLQNIPVSKIVPNPNQPRKHFDEEAFKELVASIREHGIVQPVVVRAVGSLFELVVGERRWRAAREAGLRAIPAVVRSATDVEALELALIENVQRQDLNPLEEAAAYYHLIEDFDFTQGQLAARVGKKRSTIANTIRLLKLPEQVKELLIEGKISSGHARTLLAFPDVGQQIKVAERIIKEGLTVRQVEALAQLAQNPGRKPPAQPTPPHYKSILKDLSERFSARVRVKLQEGKGRLEIHFKSEDELKRIFDMLAGGKK